MRIVIVTPAPRGSTKGNRVTAERWARMLRELGHRVTLAGEWRGAACDLLVGVHAARSAASVRRFARERPGRPIVVLLAGTDLYRQGGIAPAARRTLDSATRIVALQPLARRRLPPALRPRTRVILQSAAPPRRAARGRAATGRSRSGAFDIAVVGHLRPVKDPLRTARAARLMPVTSRIAITHAGAALSPAAARAARREMRSNPRYRWVGALSHPESLSLIARSRALVVSSRSEGGPAVISEAAVAGIPVIATRVEGCVGLLGSRHPGYFAVGDTAGLARLLRRVETEPAFRARLAASSRRLARKLTPANERAAWRRLLAEVAPGGTRPCPT